MSNGTAAQLKAEEAECRILFAEELSANDSETLALEGFNPAQSLRDIKKAVSLKLGCSTSWEKLEIVFGGAVIDGRMHTPLPCHPRLLNR